MKMSTEDSDTMTIPELASEMMKKTLSEPISNASTIVIAGSRYVGKSSLIHKFLEKNDTIRETLVLEYSFGRKSSQKSGIDKTICHVWEYGGKIEMLGDVLTSIPPEGNTFFCIMVDLSKTKRLMSTLDLCIEAIQKKITTMDSPLEIVIIGGYYDIFKNYDSEVKKLVCSTLRSVALLYKAHLIFYSNKDAQLVRRVKNMFYGMGFGDGVLIKEKNTNYSKPLIIPKNTDSWENIGMISDTIDEIKRRYADKIPQQPDELSEYTRSDLQRTHPEPILDNLIALKYEELRCIESSDPSIKEYLFSLH